jgi:hypothetical protein
MITSHSLLPPPPFTSNIKYLSYNNKNDQQIPHPKLTYYPRLKQPRFSNPPHIQLKPSHIVTFSIEIGGKDAGEIKINMFGKEVPKTV